MTLPLSIAGVKPSSRWLEELLDATGLSDRRRHRPAELSAASSSAWPWLARSSPVRPFSSPTSRRAASTRRPRPRFSASCAAPSTYGQTTVMVTHDPRAARSPTGLFLADGLIVKELGRSSQTEILETYRDLRPMRRVAIRSARSQAPVNTHGDRHRPRRRDGERHARPHRHDREGVRLDLLELVRQTDAVVSGRSSSSGRRRARPRSLRTCSRVRACRRSMPPQGRFSISQATNQAKILDKDGKAIGNNRPSASASTPRTAVQPSSSSQAHGRPARTRSWSTSTPQTNRASSGRHRQGRRRRPVARLRTGIARFGDVSSLGGATIASMSRPLAACCASRDSTLSPCAQVSAGKADRLDRECPARIGRGAHRRRQAAEDGKGVGEFGFIPLFPARLRRGSLSSSARS